MNNHTNSNRNSNSNGNSNSNSNSNHSQLNSARSLSSKSEQLPITDDPLDRPLPTTSNKSKNTGIYSSNDDMPIPALSKKGIEDMEGGYAYPASKNHNNKAKEREKEEKEKEGIHHSLPEKEGGVVAIKKKASASSLPLTLPTTADDHLEKPLPAPKDSSFYSEMEDHHVVGGNHTSSSNSNSNSNNSNSNSKPNNNSNSNNNSNQDGPEPIAPNKEKEAASLVSVFGDDLIRRLYSKTWNYREETMKKLQPFLDQQLSEIAVSYENGTSTSESSQMVSLLKSSLKVVEKGLADKITHVYYSTLNLLQYIAADFCGENSTTMLKRATVHSSMSITIHTYLPWFFVVIPIDIPSSSLLLLSSYPLIFL